MSLPTVAVRCSCGFPTKQEFWLLCDDNEGGELVIRIWRVRLEPESLQLRTDFPSGEVLNLTTEGGVWGFEMGSPTLVKICVCILGSYESSLA